MRLAALALTFALTAPAFAADGDLLTAQEFEDYSTGRTLTYASGGQVYGTEQYLPGRKVRWAFTGDECRIGYWYEQGEAICFIYEDDGNPQCWTFHHRGNGIAAHFMGDANGSELSEVSQTTDPLSCTGPDVGV